MSSSSSSAISSSSFMAFLRYFVLLKKKLKTPEQHLVTLNFFWLFSVIFFLKELIASDKIGEDRLISTIGKAKETRVFRFPKP